MVSLEILKKLTIKTPAKIVLVVMDGVGGLPHPETGKTELESAHTPNLDEIAKEGICGLMDPIVPGITPGSGPAHLALFGYDPIEYEIGRGVVEALGIGFDLQPTDVAARGNFATTDDKGIIVDRRAGRIETEKTQELCQMLQENIKLSEGEVFIRPGKMHRLVAIFRGENLSGELTDSDPQKEGKSPRPVTALSPEGRRTASLVNEFIEKARMLLKDRPRANILLLRGFAKHPQIPTMSDIYNLTPAAIATYPMYRGLAKLVGMEILSVGVSLKDEFEALKENYARFDFFYLHLKETDTAGEDGDFRRKVKVIEEFDCFLPIINELQPEVLIVTGDHSTPALLKAHSWHPLPFVLKSSWCIPDRITKFSERACRNGSLGRFSALSVMLLAMAHALKLGKYGA